MSRDEVVCIGYAFSAQTIQAHPWAMESEHASACQDIASYCAMRKWQILFPSILITEAPEEGRDGTRVRISAFATSLETI